MMGAQGHASSNNRVSIRGLTLVEHRMERRRWSALQSSLGREISKIVWVLDVAPEI